ncbi:MAG: peptidylprolyl isomerase [Acidobacteria bacterium]|nr:peptidylprolyl isomerase [Acidobacteriota bacterium]
MSQRLLLGLAVLALSSPLSFAQTVRMTTNFGTIDVVLMPESAPKTVENFLKYVRNGDYSNTFFHRYVKDFVIQGGGFKWDSRLGPVPVAQYEKVTNEYKVTNTRGTIAMAKVSGDKDSATNQWFFNLADNTTKLDGTNNGGFTVFGKVANEASQAVIDRMTGVPIVAYDGNFNEIPLVNYRTGAFTSANLLLVSSVRVLGESPDVRTTDGVMTASAFGGYSTAAPGSYVEIFGTGFAGTSREWATRDFVNGAAPTTLDDVSVTVNGRPAFISYISPTQINAQIPGDLPDGSTVPVVVTYRGNASQAVRLPLRSASAGLLAPGSFKIGDKQYVVAFRGSEWIGNGSIPGLRTTPARPGDTLTFYGIGFGPVAGNTAIAGQVVPAVTPITTPIEFSFGDSLARIESATLVKDAVGLYQFNVVVPSGLATGDVELKVKFNGLPLGQTLFIPVFNN